MADFEHSEIEKYHELVRGPTEALLQELGDQLKKGREHRHNPVPIYLTKQRVKTVDSIYLKTKRRTYDSLDQITDYGGLRILCLFDQDILPVHRYFMGVIERVGCILKEFRIFNWTEDRDIAKLQSIVRDHCPYSFFSEPYTRKASGYKSIHYVVYQERGRTKQRYHIEIQLRTLLQDIWGELEHALAYKQGSIHPFITRSFQLLSRDLATNDSLITHLRQINDKEIEAEVFALRDQGPYKVFFHDDRQLPKSFLTETGTAEAFNRYCEFIKSIATKHRVSHADRRQWVDNGRRLYEAVRSQITSDATESPEGHYWIETEKAFWLFCDLQHQEAKHIYTALVDSKNHSSKCVLAQIVHNYVVYFRLGEINFIQGNIVEALKNFDIAERLLPKDEHENILSINMWLAKVYWLMGEEYFGIALKKIEKAESEYHNKGATVHPEIARSLRNNTCWYHLEKCLLAKKLYDQENDEEKKKALERAYKDAYKKAEEKYMALEPLADDDRTTSNECDTAAWCCLQFYYHKKDPTYLEKAKKYCEKGWRRENYATYSITSVNMHRNHIQEIMEAYRKEKGM